jgi:hypothetical protein
LSSSFRAAFSISSSWSCDNGSPITVGCILPVFDFGSLWLRAVACAGDVSPSRSETLQASKRLIDKGAQRELDGTDILTVTWS